MTKTMWRAAAAAFTLAAIVAGLLVAWNVWRPSLAASTEVQHATYDRPISKLVFADFEASDISVTAGSSGDGAQVQIQRDYRWTDRKPAYTETWDGETLTVKHNCGNLSDSRCSIRYTVQVPASVAVEVDTSSGDVRIRNITGSVQVDAVSGDVTVAGARAPLNVKTVSGDVSTDDIGSTQVDVTAVSGNVDLNFTQAPQQVSVQTVSGDVTVKVPDDAQSYWAQVQTTTGDQHVTVDQSQKADRTIKVQATSGDVTIGFR